MPEYNEFLVATDLITVSPKEGAPTCDDVMKARAAYK
jgi:hypothetical protein